MIVLGRLLLAMPVITILRWKVTQRPHRLVVERPGIRWDDPGGAPWAVPWSELDIVMVHGHLTDDGVPLVSLRLYPSDPYYAGRHPEMAHLLDGSSDRDVYRVGLAVDDTFVPRLDAALTTFAPDTYVGSVLSSRRGDLIPAGTRYQVFGNRAGPDSVRLSGSTRGHQNGVPPADRHQPRGLAAPSAKPEADWRPTTAFSWNSSSVAAPV